MGNVAAIRATTAAWTRHAAKEAATAGNARLFDLLETRLAGRRPTFWASQIPLDRVRAKISRQNGGDDDQAAAIVRWLGQHSPVIGQWRMDALQVMRRSPRP